MHGFWDPSRVLTAMPWPSTIDTPPLRYPVQSLLQTTPIPSLPPLLHYPSPDTPAHAVTHVPGMASQCRYFITDASWRACRTAGQKPSPPLAASSRCRNVPRSRYSSTMKLLTQLLSRRKEEEKEEQEEDGARDGRKGGGEGGRTEGRVEGWGDAIGGVERSPVHAAVIT